MQRNDRRVALSKINYLALQAAAGDSSSMAEYLNVLLAQVLQPIAINHDSVPKQAESQDVKSRLKEKMNGFPIAKAG